MSGCWTFYLIIPPNRQNAPRSNIMCCLDPIPDLSLLSAPLLPYLVSFYFASLKTQHRGGMLRLTSRNFLTPTHLTSYIYTKVIKVKGWRQNSYSHLILPSCKQSCLLLFTLLIAKRWIPSYWNLLNCCLPLLVSLLFVRVLLRYWIKLHFN